MKYFILYYISAPSSLLFGLQLTEAATLAEADAIADAARRKGCSGVRIIQGVEVSAEVMDSPLRVVEFSTLTSA